MARMPGATWSPSPNHGGRRIDFRWLIVHRTVGSFPGDLKTLRNAATQTGATFYVRKSGEIHQLHDTTDVPWTSKDANPRSVTIEFEAGANDALTPAQVEAGAEIAVFVHKAHGTPLVAVTNPAKQGGVSYHRHGAMFGLDWGRTACPGDKVVAQIPGLVARARQIVGGVDAPETDEEFTVTQYEVLVKKLNGALEGINVLGGLIRAQARRDAADEAEGGREHAALVAKLDQLETLVRDAKEAA